MRVDIETICKTEAFRRTVNSIPLRNIEFFEKGKPIFIFAKDMDDWELTGLNNIDFIISMAYKGKEQGYER